MNISNGALYFGAGIDLVQWRRDIDSMRRDILGLTQSTVRETGNMDSAFKNLSIGIAGYFSASMLKDFTMQLINVRGEFQKTEVAFATMLGDGDKARDLMEQMVELAAKTPFSLQDVSSGAKQLLAFQVPANQVVDVLTRMGNIASGLGVPLSRINLVYGQVKAKGRLMGDDLRQFTEAGIPMVAELAKKFNKTTSEITDMVTAGKIGFKDVKDVLFSLTDEGGMFFNLMEKQSSTLSGRVSNLGDEFSQMLNKIGQNQEGLLSSGIDGVTNLIEHYEDVADILLVLISTYGAYRAALIATVAIQRASVVAGNVQAFLQLASSIRSAKDAQILFNTVTKANPYVIAATALAALSAALYVYYNRVSDAEKAQQELNAEISKQQAPIAATKAKIDSLVSAIKQENVSNSQRAEWLKQIKVLSNGRLNQLTVEEIRTNKASNAINSYIKQLQKEAEAKAYLARITDFTEKREQLRAKLKTKLTAGDLLDDLTDFNTVTHDKNGKLLTTLERRNIRTINEINAQSAEIQKSRDKIERLTKEGVNVSDVISETDTTKLEDGAKKVKRELAEVYSLNSIADLEQRIDLWNEALRKASGDTVNVLNKNKFGDVVKTSKTVSVSVAVAEVEKLEKARAKREKEIQVQSFQERLDETKRQIEVRDKLLKSGYSKDVVDEMFPAVKDKSFLQYLNETGSALEKLNDKGSAENLVQLQNILADYTGAESFIENVNKQIDELKSKFTGDELINKLEKFKKANLAGTTGDEKNLKNIAIDKAQEEERIKQKQLYNQFVKDHETFEQRKTEITRQYDDIRKKIEESNVSDVEKTRQIDEANKAQSKDISSMSVELFQKTDLWVKAFGDLEKVGPKTLRKMREEFQNFLNSDAGQKLKPEDILVIQDAIKRLDDTAKTRNPFEAIGNSIKKYSTEKKKLADAEKKYGKNSAEYNNQLDATKAALAGIFETAGAAVSGTIAFASSLGGALGMLSEESQQALKDVEQLVEGVSNAVAGYFSGNYGQMAGGIVQMVVSISSLVSGDNAREKNIREWQRAVEDLKTSYRELQRIIEKTAGERSLFDNRKLITNLAEQQQRLKSIREEEANKKKADKDKISGYDQQIRDIDMQIEDLIDNFKKSVTTVEFKELSQKIADAIVDGFAQGEDAAKSFDKVVDDVMRNAVKNALQIKILQPAMEKFVDDFYSAMGYGKDDSSANDAIKSQIDNLKKDISNTEDRIKYIANLDFNERQWFLKELNELNDKKQELLMKVANLQSQLTSNPIGGAFDGLTPEEIAKLKEGPQAAVKEFADLWKAFQDSFPALNETASSLKGDIKSITEKTAGALEGQFNAVRINISEVLKIMKGNQTVANAQTILLSKIESNTSNLIQIRKDIAELNSKVKNTLAGI